MPLRIRCNAREVPVDFYFGFKRFIQEVSWLLFHGITVILRIMCSTEYIHVIFI